MYKRNDNLIAILLFSCIIMTLTFNTNSQTEKWKYLYSSGDSVKYYYDNNSIYFNGTKFTVWCSFEYKINSNENDHVIHSLIEFDCYYKTFQLFYQIVYKRGGIKEEKDYNGLDFKFIIEPNDQFEPYLNTICK